MKSTAYKTIAFLCIIGAMGTVVSCKSLNKHKPAANITVQESTDNDIPEGYELPLPEIPDSIVDPQERAGVLLKHFWDGCDFTDTERSLDPDFIEINFVNFINVFPYAGDEDVRQAVANLISAAQVDESVLGLVAETAESYLYDPNSPYLSEDYFIVFLEQLLQSPVLEEYQKLRYEMMLKAALKNRPGTMAADFSFTDRKGRVRSLRATPVSDLLLLIFYDPDCESCREVISYLSHNEAVSELISDGILKVLAIYSGGDRELWESTSVIPEEWTDGFDTGRISNENLYILRASPTLYLLDNNKTVLQKDLQPAMVVPYINSLL